MPPAFRLRAHIAGKSDAFERITLRYTGAGIFGRFKKEIEQ